MSFIKHDAPRTLLSFIWATAAMLTIFFAVILSSFFVLKHYYPVSADDVTMKAVSGNCVLGETRVGVNNYPQQAAITSGYPKTDPLVKNGYQHGPVESALGGDYQCSNICVPGLDQSKAVNETANLSVITNFLSGATVGDQPMIPLQNGDQFVNKVKAYYAETDATKKQADKDELKRMMILPYSKTTICAGDPGGLGQSVDYAEIKAKDKKPVTTEEPNKTKEQANIPQAQQKAATNAAAPVPIAGAPLTKLDAPVTGGTAANSNASPDLKTCSTKVNDFLYKYKTMLDQVPSDQNQSDPDITRYGEIRDAYLGLKKPPYLGDEDKSFKKCLEIEKLVDNMSNKLWGTKTELALCKKTLNEFLAKYPTDTTQSGAISQFRYNVASRYYYIKYNPWYWVSAIRQLNTCKEALSYIDKYKVAIGAMYGPPQQDDVQQPAAARVNPQSMSDAVYTAATEAYWSDLSWRAANMGTIGKFTWKVYHKGSSWATLVQSKQTQRIFWSINYNGTWYINDVYTRYWNPTRGGFPDMEHLLPVGQRYFKPPPFTSDYYSSSVVQSP